MRYVSLQLMRLVPQLILYFDIIAYHSSQDQTTIKKLTHHLKTQVVAKTHNSPMPRYLINSYCDYWDA